MNKANPANKPQEKADHMPGSFGKAHGTLHTEKRDHHPAAAGAPKKFVANVAAPDAGGSGQIGSKSNNSLPGVKVPDGCDDALGNPSRFHRASGDPKGTERPAAAKTARDKQLGNNGKLAN